MALSSSLKNWPVYGLFIVIVLVALTFPRTDIVLSDQEYAQNQFLGNFLIDLLEDFSELFAEENKHSKNNIGGGESSGHGSTLTLTSLNPNVVSNKVENKLTLTGSGFSTTNCGVSIDGTELSVYRHKITCVSPSEITFVLPAGYPPGGSYQVRATETMDPNRYFDDSTLCGGRLDQGGGLFLSWWGGEEGEYFSTNSIQGPKAHLNPTTYNFLSSVRVQYVGDSSGQGNDGKGAFGGAPWNPTTLQIIGPPFHLGIITGSKPFPKPFVRNGTTYDYETYYPLISSDYFLIGPNRHGISPQVLSGGNNFRNSFVAINKFHAAANEDVVLHAVFGNFRGGDRGNRDLWGFADDFRWNASTRSTVGYPNCPSYCGSNDNNIHVVIFQERGGVGFKDRPDITDPKTPFIAPFDSLPRGPHLITIHRSAIDDKVRVYADGSLTDPPGADWRSVPGEWKIAGVGFDGIPNSMLDDAGMQYVMCRGPAAMTTFNQDVDKLTKRWDLPYRSLSIGTPAQSNALPLTVSASNNTPPTIWSQLPTPSASFRGGSTVQFRALVNDPDGGQVNVKLYVRRADANFLPRDIKWDSNVNVPHMFDYTIRGLTKGVYFWKLEASDGQSPSVSSQTQNFTIRNARPSITGLSPPDRHVYTNLSTVEIKAVVADLDNDLVTAKILVRKGSSPRPSDEVFRLQRFGGTPFVVSHTLTSLSGGIYFWRVEANDREEVTISSERQFIIMTTPSSLCGNGIIESGETCDDSNNVSGDGCSTICQIEIGWTCSGEPSMCTRTRANNPPVLNPIGDKIAVVGVPIAFSLSAFDPDNDSINFIVTNNPSGSAFNGTIGAFWWNASSAQIGNHTVTFTVTDGKLTDNETITIEVLSPKDDDGDGVPNFKDRCKKTPPGHKVNIFGCSRPLHNFSKHLTTNFTKADLLNVTNLTLGKDGIGGVLFAGHKIPLLKKGPLRYHRVNLNKIIIEKNKIAINTSNPNLTVFNKSAILVFFNVDMKNPQILVDKKPCSACIVIFFQNRILVVSVPHFSEYTIEEGFFCGDNSCNGGETCSSCSQDCGQCKGGDKRSGGGGGGGGGGTTFVCRTGEKQPCGSSVGECTTGTQTCSNNKWGACTGGTQPTKEICDGKDNNCNAVIDDGNTCLECKPGETKSCGSPIGICTEGLQKCENGIWGDCQGNIPPKLTEICSNNLDDNCNGEIDESCEAPNHCSNFVQDENEEGIDCGGSCPACFIYIDHTITLFYALFVVIGGLLVAGYLFVRNT